MKQKSNIRYKKIDGFYLLFFFFALPLFTLFFYILRIDSYIKHYSNYREQLQTMTILDHEIETIFHQRYRYVDYDKVSQLMKAFEICLVTLDNALKNPDNFMRRFIS